MNLVLILKTNFGMLKNLKTPEITLICHTNSVICNYKVNAFDLEDDNDGPDFTKKKVIKIKSLYQMLYNLHGGKEKTPRHLFIAHSVNGKCKSREVLTSLNKAGVSGSYNKV